MECKIVADGETFPLEDEELIEILATIRDTPVRGKEYFEDAKQKACDILRRLPDIAY